MKLLHDNKIKKDITLMMNTVMDDVRKQLNGLISFDYRLYGGASNNFIVIDDDGVINLEYFIVINKINKDVNLKKFNILINKIRKAFDNSFNKFDNDNMLIRLKPLNGYGMIINDAPISVIFHLVLFDHEYYLIEHDNGNNYQLFKLIDHSKVTGKIQYVKAHLNTDKIKKEFLKKLIDMEGKMFVSFIFLQAINNMYKTLLNKNQ